MTPDMIPRTIAPTEGPVTGHSLEVCRPRQGEGQGGATHEVSLLFGGGGTHQVCLPVQGGDRGGVIQEALERVVVIIPNASIRDQGAQV